MYTETLKGPLLANIGTGQATFIEWFLILDLYLCQVDII
jgi:hypothetical protein